MPRPKRAKVAPSAPATIFPPSKHATTSNPQNRLSSPKSRATTNSDDSAGIVKRNTSGKNRRGVAKQDAEMSGALLVSSGDSSTRSRSTTRKDGSKICKEQDRLLASETLRGNANGNSQNKELLPNLQEFSSHPDHQKVAMKHLDSRNRYREGVFASAMKRPESSAGVNWRSQTTPQADSSILSLANFKRRPRQPSLLGIGRPDNSPSISSLGGLEMEYSVFKGENSHKAPGLDFTIMDDLSDFEPQNESTPFVIAKGAPARQLRSVSVSSSSSVGPGSCIDRVEDALESPGSAFESQLGKGLQALSSTLGYSLNNRKKRKSITEVQVSQSQQSPTSPLELENGGTGTNPNEFLDEPELPAPKRRAVGLDAATDLMAPPRSSSPIGSQPLPSKELVSGRVPPRGDRPKRSRPGHEARQAHSRKTNENGLTALSTATLQSFLPRRRNTRHHQQFDIHSDSPEPVMDEDEDELSYMGSGRRANNRAKKPTASNSKTPKSNVHSRTTNVINSLATASNRRVPVDGLGPSKLTRTYGRRLSDKENEPDSISSAEGDESNESLMPVSESCAVEINTDLSEKARKELRKLAKKFKEVDEWTMEFEDVTASSSSPKDAR